MSTAQKIVDDLIEGKVGDWFADKWNDVKVATGIGHDSFGMGKPEKGFKPKYKPGRNLPPRKPVTRSETGEHTWNITP